MWRNDFLKILLLCFVFTGKVLAQDTSSAKVDTETSVKLNEFDQKRWNSLTKDLDYTETLKKKKQERPFSLPGFNLNQTAIKIVLIVIVIGALTFLLWKIFGNTKFLKNRKIKTGDFSMLDEAEENLEISDLESFLKDALSKKQYKIAVRIYYLMTIKELMLHNFIVWKKNKTNFEYLSEMSEKKEFDQFHTLTRAFEIVWYGDVEPDEKDFAVLSPTFGNFINSIRNNGQK